MPSFTHDNLKLAYFDEGEPAGDPVLLIHGFASSKTVNWIGPGWLKTLGEAGYRVIAHRQSRPWRKRQAARHRSLYAGKDGRRRDRAAASISEITSAHVMGYSMGARISAFMALDRAANDAFAWSSAVLASE
jgi:pimeloyl-ACP methyl ester carboxylesterase